LPGWILFVLARRLRRQGFVVHIFSYPTVRADLRTNAARLAGFLGTLDAETVHLVGHSLGGILIRALFHYHPDQKPGRIVTLVTPHGGSCVAQHLSRYAGWRWWMGKSIAQLLAGAPQRWLTPAREIGTISGSRSVSLGRLVYRQLPLPNDGLLTLTESRFAAAQDQVVLPVSHTGILFSSVAAEQTAHFLVSGKFHPSRQGAENMNR
jgi:pimeloyl-ACP methyl ester carboxylesterase